MNVNFGCEGTTFIETTQSKDTPYFFNWVEGDIHLLANINLVCAYIKQHISRNFLRSSSRYQIITMITP